MCPYVGAYVSACIVHMCVFVPVYDVAVPIYV